MVRIVTPNPTEIAVSMSEAESHITPTEINLHQKSRLLEIAFSDGFRFKYPCEYLRVFSTSAEVKVMDKPVGGKQRVNISQIEPQGTYAIRIHFDDGHDTGIYSWGTLYELGKNYDSNWKEYLAKLEEFGLSRGEGRATGVDGKVTIKILYFIDLAKISGKDEEEVVIPDSVTDVESLLAWLRKRGLRWADSFAYDKVQVTVNRQFAEPFTLIEHGDEVAIVPRPT